MTEKNGRDYDKQRFAGKLNALIQKTVMEEGKLEEDLNFFHNNKANQQQQQEKNPLKKGKIHH